MDRRLRLIKQAWGLYLMREEQYRVSPNAHTRAQMEIRKTAMDLLLREAIAVANRGVSKV